MKNTNEEIDELIHSALTKKEAEFYDSLGEQNLLEMQWSVFKGKNGWLAYMTMFFILLIFGVFIYSTIEFVNSDDPSMTTKWGILALASLLGVGQLKLWHWLQIDKNAILREMKRLELQLSILTSHLEKNK